MGYRVIQMWEACCCGLVLQEGSSRDRHQVGLECALGRLSLKLFLILLPLCKVPFSYSPTFGLNIGNTLAGLYWIESYEHTKLSLSIYAQEI